MPRSSSRSTVPSTRAVGARRVRPGRRLPALTTLSLGVIALVAAACGDATASASPSSAPSVVPPTASATAPSAAAATSTPSPAATTPAPTTAPATAAGDAGCLPDNLRVTSPGWEAGAGSRMAMVTVANGASAACELPATATVRIVDAAGNVLLESEPESAEGSATLEPGGESTFAIRFGNWCEQNAAFPLRPVLVVDETAGVQIDGLDLATTDDTPPCNGPGQAPVLTTTAWGG